MASYNFTSFDNIASAEMKKKWSGTWQADIRLALDTAPALSLQNEINIDGETFFVVNLNKTREGGKLYLDVTADHQFFKLENSVVTETYVLEGNITEHINKLLEYQTDTNFSVSYEPSLSDSETNDFMSLESEQEIEPGYIYKRIKSILKQFLARYRVTGNTIYVMPQDHYISSDLSFEYGLNSKKIQREINIDKVCNKLVARAWLKGIVVEGDRDPTVIKTYGSGTPERFKDFGTFSSMANLDYAANKYLSYHSIPDAEYKMSVVDLLNMPSLRRPSGVSDTKIDVGLGVDVIDSEMGINETLKIQEYSYSLIESHQPASIVVGQIKSDYFKEFEDEVVNTKQDLERREPKLYTTTDPTVDPDPEMGKDGDVFVRPK